MKRRATGWRVAVAVCVLPVAVACGQPNAGLVSQAAPAGGAEERLATPVAVNRPAERASRKPAARKRPAAARKPAAVVTPARPAPKPPAKPAVAPGVVELPAWGPGGAPRMAIRATIVGDARLGCVWLLYGNGTRSAALWPSPGYTAKFAPLRVYDAGGREVWREGEIRDTGGGPSPQRLDRVPKQCRTGDTAFWLWGAGEKV